MRSVVRLAAAEGSTKSEINQSKKVPSEAAEQKNTYRLFFSRMIALAALALAAASPAARAETVAGVTIGALSVDPAGAASYSVPIAVPPGVAGMEPDLSLIYSSRADNGILGMGWSLGGLSIIHRCPRTLVQDNVKGGVNFDAEDRFCLDGQRLIAIAGAYGADGTEYRTEIDGFSRIVSHGTAGSGPAYFTVETKAGQTLAYGGTSDSRVPIPGRDEARFWALNRVEDRVGNYMTLHYWHDWTTDDTCRIDRIEYAGNTAAGTAPQSTVQFLYEARPDTREAYQAGARINMAHRMTGIRTSTDGALVRDYRLAYDESPATGRSRLRSVTECDAAGDCLVPTDFDWAPAVGGGWQSAPDFTPPDILAASNWGDVGARFVDVNGDGLTDFLHSRLNKSGVFDGAYLSTGSGWQSAPAFTPPDILAASNWSDVGARFIDLNGDGLTDFLHKRVWSGGVVEGAYLNTGSGWQAAPQFIPPDYLGAEGWGDVGARLVDVNGDGLPDFLHSRIWGGGGSSKGAYLNTGSGWQSVPAFTPPDILAASNWSDVGARFIDLNGDGLTDFLHKRLWSGGVVEGAYLNTGSGWQAAPQFIPPDYLGAEGWGRIGAELTDVDGDGLADFLHSRIWGGGGFSKGAFLNTAAIEHLATITDSLGRNTTITYAPLTDPSVYTKGTGAVFPEQDVQGPLYVVQEVASDDGVGGQARTTYAYEGARAHLQGRGFLGFARMTAVDEQTGIETTTDYLQDFPFIGRVAATEARLADGTLISRAADTWEEKPTNGGLTRFPFVSQSQAESFEINDGPGNLPVVTVTTTKVYDDFGNPTSTVTTTAGGGETFTKTADNAFTNDTVNWLLGQLDRATVTDALPDLSSATRVAAFAYDPVTGLLIQEKVEPDRPVFTLTTDYGHDVFGNLLTETVGGPDVAARTTTRGFSADGRFAETLTNALGHGETRAFDARFGTVTRLTGPNGITTTWDYDGFGRKTREARADGTETRWAYALCAAQCPPGGVYAVSQQDFDSASGAAIGPRAVEYFDALNRGFRSETEGFDGTRVFADTTFNARGEVVAVTRPYFAGTAAADIHETVTTYDDIGRPTSVTQPDGGVTTSDYGGLTTTSTNALTQVETRRTNALGQLVEATDNLGTTIAYSYEPFGNLTETNAGGVVTTVGYDIRGRKISMDDPNMGAWSYDYNVLGELISQTDAKLQTVDLFYDALGRLERRVEDEGTTEWFYDTAAKGVGKLHRVTAPGGYEGTQSYDSLGRPSATSVTIDGTTYTHAVGYDLSGRPETLTYPSGFAVRNAYNARGYLASVSEDGGATVFWQADSVNAEGQVTRETFGNGIVTTNAYDPRTALIDSIATLDGPTAIQDLAYDFDLLGNLKQRADLRQDRQEDFLYDGLNRLTTTTLIDTGAGGGTLATAAATYDALGNLKTKSDVGTYVYGGPRPHAVTAAGGETYAYDANGSMISGAGREITYASFNKPTLIRETATGNEAGFVYGPDRARIKQRAVEGGLVREVVYVGSLYERRTRFGSPDELVHHIAAGGTVAIHTIYDDNLPATDKTRYLHRDHLGSVESITGETGAVVQRLSFDAHGKRRLADWTAGDPAGPDAETPRGFTGHEHLDSVGLIHMNGRVYDPVLGRFVSADPHVQAPDATQSFNRYSYVVNNPLSYTDPSGFFFDKIKDAFKKIGRALSDAGEAAWKVAREALQNQWVQQAVQIGLAALPPPYNIIASAAFAGLTTLANHGSLSDALMAATVAALNGSMTPNAEGGQQGQDGGDLLGQLLAAGLKHLTSDLFKEQVESAVNTVRATVSDAVQHLDMAYDSLSTLEKVQLTLDVVSVGLEASVIGAPLAMVADLASAVLSLAQGDWLGFGLGLAAIVPVVGLAANAARLGRRADLVEDAATFCRFSFDGETLVRTEDGFVPIEDIRPRADSVLARDEETGEQAYKPVLAQHRSRYDETVRVTIRDLETGAEQTIAANRVHPFYVADEVSELRLVAAGGGAAPVLGTNDTGRWVQAHNLVAGDRLLNADEGWSEVTSVRVERKPLLAYNLTVADFHTFFVKAPEANDNDAVWVHNVTCKVSTNDALKTASGSLNNAAAAARVQPYGPSASRLGSGKSADRWASQLSRRGWTQGQISEAIARGQQFQAPNRLNPANGATRYVHPGTGRSVVVDNVTREVIHVGGDGFKY